MGRDLLEPLVCSTTASLAAFSCLAPRVGVGGGCRGSEHAAVSPPCKAQAFSWVRAIFHRPRSDEQRQKTQILLSGHSGPYVGLQWLSSRTFPTQPVTPNSSLDSGDAGARAPSLALCMAMTSLGERRDICCSFAMILPFSCTVAPVLSQTSALAPGLLLELPLMLCFK